MTQAVTLIITRFLPLKPADLEKWEADPEEWVLEESKDYEAWEFDIRVCSIFCADVALAQIVRVTEDLCRAGPNDLYRQISALCTANTPRYVECRTQCVCFVMSQYSD